MQVLALYQADQKVIITFNVCNSGSCDPQLLGIDLSASNQPYALRCSAAAYHFSAPPRHCKYTLAPR